MEALARRYITVEEYFELEERSEEKHEYFRGEMFAMAGGTPQHATLQYNLTGLVHAQLRGRPCRGYSSDFRVHVEAVGLYTYPDFTVVCGEPRLQGQLALLNPTLLFEVLSPSTEAYDRGDKFSMYRQLESLQQYVLIPQTRVAVEVFTRKPGGGWHFEAFSGPDAVAQLESIGCTILLRDLYEGVDLSARAPQTTVADPAGTYSARTADPRP